MIASGCKQDMQFQRIIHAIVIANMPARSPLEDSRADCDEGRGTKGRDTQVDGRRTKGRA